MPPSRDSLAVSAPAGQIPPGSVIGGRFRIEGVLQQDAVGLTYRATDVNRRSAASIRIIPIRALGPLAAQLETDIENASALVHKNLIEVLTAGRESDFFFIATELLDGQTLREFIDGKRREGRAVSFKGACNLITHVANGLERAAGFMPHGGLNPASVWVNKAGRVKVADLGLARTIPLLARRGAPSGAPDHAYVAPEVLAGAPPTSASDVFALGVLLYEVVTGRLPSSPFRPLSEAAADVPSAADAILARAFARAPEARFSSPMELRDALARVQGGGAGHPAGPADVPPAARQAAAQPAKAQPPASAPRGSVGRSFNVAEAAGAAIDDAQERWLIQKDRLDFGPFSLAQIRAQIVSGEILGEHLIVDSDTGARKKVKDFPALRDFTKTSERHREQNRRAVAEQRQESVDKKKSIFTFVVVSILLVTAVGGVGLFFLTRKPKDEVKLATREEEAEIDAFLRDVKLSFGGAHKRVGGHHAVSGASSGAGDADFSNDSNFGDASKYASAGDETLDDGVIEETMMKHYRGLVPCLMSERKHNPGLSEMSLDFVVRGNGKVSAVKVNGQKGGFSSCVLSRMPTFPRFNGSKTIASWSMSMR
jgi:eukaryotic-like serine/threonine-protein kinase